MSRLELCSSRNRNIKYTHTYPHKTTQKGRNISMENLIKSRVSSLSCLQHHFICFLYGVYVSVCTISPSFGCIVTIILHFFLIDTHRTRRRHECVYGEKWQTRQTIACPSPSIPEMFICVTDIVHLYSRLAVSMK